jgi:Tfp pilus assembly protein PilF
MDERLEDLVHAAREHYTRSEYDAAEPLLARAIERGGDYADVHDMMGVILHDRGDLAGAQRHFSRAAELNPDYTEALLNLAVTHADRGDYDAAREVYDKLREGHAGTVEDPFVRGKIANKHAELAQAYLDARCPHDALRELERAVELCPTFPDLRTRLARLYRASDNHALAREHLAAAIQANPRYAPAHVLFGLTMISLGSLDRAVSSFRAALAAEPDNRAAKMYLRLVEHQRNTRAARQTSRAEDGASTP